MNASPNNSIMDMDPAQRMHLLLTGKTSDEVTRKDRALKFPIKLMYVIECGDYSDIIDWCHSGRAFIIKNPKRFETIVLPEIFKEAKFNSFDRKIKRWGFIKGKLNRGVTSCCYGHPNFQKGNYRLCMTIACTKYAKQEQSDFSMAPSLLTSMALPNSGSSNPLSSSCSLLSDTGILALNQGARNDHSGLGLNRDMTVSNIMSTSTQVGPANLRPDESSLLASLPSTNYAGFSQCQSLSSILPGSIFRQNQLALTGGTNHYSNEEPSLERRLRYEMMRLRSNVTALNRKPTITESLQHYDFIRKAQTDSINDATIRQYLALRSIASRGL